MVSVLLLTLALASTSMAAQMGLEERKVAANVPTYRKRSMAIRCSDSHSVRHGQKCGCGDICLDNSDCQRDDQGGFTCQCAVCQYFDTHSKKCIDIPDYGDVCTTTCLPGFECLSNSLGGRFCSCPHSQEFDPDVGRCVNALGYGKLCKKRCFGGLECRDSGVGPKMCLCEGDLLYNPKTRKCDITCINDSAETCYDLPNGHYPVCVLRCKKGIYANCDGGSVSVRDCALASYMRPNRRPYTDKMVYHPDLKRCNMTASYCPRVHDAWVVK